MMMLRYCALVAGLVCVGCETWGTYDFLIRDQGGWNYIVVGGLTVAGLAGVLPVFAEQARVSGRRALTWACWLALPLALVFIFTAAIQRTGGAADLAQQGRVKAERERILAERTEKEATEGLPTARAAALAECASGRRGRCLEAESKVQAVEGRIAEARVALAKAPVHEDDAMARRIVRILPVTEEQVQLYQPLFLPMLLAAFGAIFLAFGAHAATAAQSEEDEIRELVRQLAWDAKTPEKIDMGDGQYILKADLRKAVSDGTL